MRSRIKYKKPSFSKVNVKKKEKYISLRQYKLTPRVNSNKTSDNEIYNNSFYLNFL